jgi:hypothetical protein
VYLHAYRNRGVKVAAQYGFAIRLGREEDMALRVTEDQSIEEQGRVLFYSGAWPREIASGKCWLEETRFLGRIRGEDW